MIPVLNVSETIYPNMLLNNSNMVSFAILTEKTYSKELVKYNSIISPNME